MDTQRSAVDVHGGLNRVHHCDVDAVEQPGKTGRLVDEAETHFEPPQRHHSPRRRPRPTGPTVSPLGAVQVDRNKSEPQIDSLGRRWIAGLGAQCSSILNETHAVRT